MISTRRLLKAAATLIATLVIALVANRPTEAIIVIGSRLANFGYVGLAAGQIARIHVFNHEDMQSNQPCMAGLRLFDDANNVLAESNAALSPGESAQLNYTAQRAQKVRAIVASIGQKGNKACSASFEIVDKRSGRALVFTNMADIVSHPYNYHDIADWGVVQFNEP